MTPHAAILFGNYNSPAIKQKALKIHTILPKLWKLENLAFTINAQLPVHITHFYGTRQDRLYLFLGTLIGKEKPIVRLYFDELGAFTIMLFY